MPTFDEHEGFTIDWVMLCMGCIVWPAIFLNIPPAEWNSSSSWFKYTAVMFWFSILGHTMYGRRYFYPYLKYIPDRTPPIAEKGGRTYNMTLLRYGALNTWNWINYGFFVQGLLSWKWSYTNGPVTLPDWIIFMMTYPFGAVCGSTFAKHGWYQPLVVLGVAPTMMLIALAKTPAA